MNEAKHDPTQYTYFVDGTEYDSPHETVTGQYIKSRISGLDPSYALFLETPGPDPDQQINDDTSISLASEHGKAPKHFYTVPPASFGLR